MQNVLTDHKTVFKINKKDIFRKNQTVRNFDRKITKSIIIGYSKKKNGLNHERKVKILRWTALYIKMKNCL